MRRLPKLRTLLRQVFLGVVAPLLFHGQSSLRSASPELTKVWDVYLGPAADGMIYRTAVCPNGSLALIEWQTTTKISRIRIVNDVGWGAQLQSPFEIASGKAAASCDSLNRIVIASKDRLTVIEQQGADGKVISSEIPISAGVIPERVQVSPSGEFYVLGVDLQAKPRIVRLSRSGELQRAAAAVAAAGSLGWDSANGHLLFVPEGRFEVWRLGAELAPLSVMRPQSNFRAKGDAVGAEEGVGDRVLRTAWLPDGRMVAQRLGQSLQGGILNQAPVFEVVDAAGGLHSVTNEQIPGRLAGASSDGSLYFSAVTDEGIRVSKMKLQ